jgi:predicted transcriptional regulator
MYINDLKDKFSNHKEFRLDDIILFYTSIDSDLKKSTIQWRVSRLLKLGIIQRTGRGKYAFGNLQKFSPYPTSNIKKVHQIIMQRCFNVKYCIWSTQWLESFLPNIASQYITFIEVENTNSAAVFFELWRDAENLFYKIPSKIPRQFGKNVIIIKKLISGSPLLESNEIVYPHLEKMIVDLYCDWAKIYPYKNPTFYKFFKKLHSNYSINESKLLRYADRRKKKMVFVKHLQRLKYLNS